MAEIVSAAVISGSLVLGLSDGQIINCGVVQGPQGLQGPQGPMGATGRPGVDGNTILHSAGNPRPDLGRDGDWHINTVKYVIQLKESGVWGKPQPLLVDGSAMGTLDQGGKRVKGAPRFFPMGGASSGVYLPPDPGSGGLELIIGHNQPLVANTPSPVAIDTTGDVMIVDLWAQGPQGTLFVEVAVSKGAGTDTGYSVVYEVRMGAVPPVLTFIPGTNAAGTDLQLQVSSDVALITLRGRVLKI